MIGPMPQAHAPAHRLHLLACIAAIAMPASGAAYAAPAASAVVAQIGLGNLLNTGQDFAVKQALSAFGKSLGDQLPIVVGNGDAFPTTPTLPGPPFVPSATPKIAALLRFSRDGTVAMPRGDYVFPVDAFCMRAHAGSPLAHRYLVAQLHGSAADIITALNSRIPSYVVDHHVLQVLSWDIQAGMAYDGMARDQREAVDRIIPDYRSRLNSDVYERIRDQYSRVSQNVPGMPSFEGALSRLGPPGQAVVALQNLRQELAQPPPTFDELARSLVPFLPGENIVNASSQSTPWSRYSDRVYVRFVTAGNYATPGIYQVRVLPAPNTADRGRTVSPPLFSLASYTGNRSEAHTAVVQTAVANLAAVPFTNIVNNPGTDSVQPLTQTPRSGPAGPSAPAPAPPPTSPTIISTTYATVPENRARTLVGVGEQVRLEFSGAGGQAIWSFSGKDGHIEPKLGSTITYYAASEAATETITATGPGSATASITFTVIPPSGVVQRIDPHYPVIHTQYAADIGFWSDSYITPATVSFQYIKVWEGEVIGTASGVYADRPRGHNPAPDPTQVLGVYLPWGSVVPGHDQNYSGIPAGLALWLRPRYAPGHLELKIPWCYVLSTGSEEHQFATVDAVFTLEADGKTLRASKAGASSAADVDSPTVGPPTLSTPNTSTGSKACPP